MKKKLKQNAEQYGVREGSPVGSRGCLATQLATTPYSLYHPISLT